MGQPKGRYRQRRSWGSIIPKKVSNKSVYFVAYTGPDSKRHTAGRSFVTETDAEAWLAAERRLISMDTWTPPKARRQKSRAEAMTVAELVQAHEKHLEETNAIRRSTLQSYRNTTASRIIDVTGPAGTLKSVPLSYLNSEHARHWWHSICRQYPDTEATNRRAYVRLRAAAAWGAESSSIPLSTNPIYVPKAGSKPEGRRKQLPNAAEMRSIIDHLPPRYKALGVLTLFHGLRIGEALGLQRRHVVLSDTGGEIHVRGNVQRIKGDNGSYSMVWQEPKTSAGERTVPIFPEFAPLLRRHLDTFAGPRQTDLFTPTETGSTVFDTSFRSIFARARTVAKVRDDLTPHHGRNYLITLLAERGATPAEIGSILGQEDVATIVGVYMRARESRKRSLMMDAEFAQGDT